MAQQKQKLEIKFSECISKAFDLYKDNFLVLLVITFVAVALSVLSIGILSGPMLAGVILVTLGLLDGKEPKPVIADVFKGFDCFLPAFLFVLVWTVATVVLQVLAKLLFVESVNGVLQILIVIVIKTLAMFGLFLIVDQKIGFWPASLQSMKIAKQNFLILLAVVLVAGVISAAGFLACGIGVVVTAPMFLCILSVVYRDVVKGSN